MQNVYWKLLVLPIGTPQEWMISEGVHVFPRYSLPPPLPYAWWKMKSNPTKKSNNYNRPICFVSFSDEMENFSGKKENKWWKDWRKKKPGKLKKDQDWSFNFFEPLLCSRMNAFQFFLCCVNVQVIMNEKNDFRKGSKSQPEWNEDIKTGNHRLTFESVSLCVLLILICVRVFFIFERKVLYQKVYFLFSVKWPSSVTQMFFFSWNTHMFVWIHDGM